MNYEKINDVLMKILENKYGIKINSKVEVKTNEIQERSQICKT